LVLRRVLKTFKPIWLEKDDISSRAFKEQLVPHFFLHRVLLLIVWFCLEISGVKSHGQDFESGVHPTKAVR